MDKKDMTLWSSNGKIPDENGRIDGLFYYNLLLSSDGNVLLSNNLDIEDNYGFCVTDVDINDVFMDSDDFVFNELLEKYDINEVFDFDEVYSPMVADDLLNDAIENPYKAIFRNDTPEEVIYAKENKSKKWIFLEEGEKTFCETLFKCKYDDKLVDVVGIGNSPDVIRDGYENWGMVIDNKLKTMGEMSSPEDLIIEGNYQFISADYRNLLLKYWDESSMEKRFEEHAKEQMKSFNKVPAHSVRFASQLPLQASKDIVEHVLKLHEYDAKDRLLMIKGALDNNWELVKDYEELDNIFNKYIMNDNEINTFISLEKEGVNKTIISNRDATVVIANSDNIFSAVAFKGNEIYKTINKVIGIPTTESAKEDAKNELLMDFNIDLNVADERTIFATTKESFDIDKFLEKGFSNRTKEINVASPKRSIAQRKADALEKAKGQTKQKNERTIDDIDK